MSDELPTAAMIAAGWSVMDQIKNLAGVRQLGPGPGVVEIYKAMEAARPVRAEPAGQAGLIRAFIAGAQYARAHPGGGLIARSRAANAYALKALSPTVSEEASRG